MIKSKRENLLSYYPAFSFINWMKKLGIVSSPTQSLVLTIVFIILILTSSFFDNSFFLKKPNIGLFEQPAIWTFFLIQIIIPFALEKSIKNFWDMPKWKYSIIKKDFFKEEFVKESESLVKNISRENLLSKFIFNLLFIFGLIGFIWNSYQNQLPQALLGFDFWDSYNYQFGYWATRLYKFYMWCVFFPSITHLYIFIMIKTLEIIKLSYTLNMLSIEPYHFDKNGGTSIFLKNIITPIIPVLFSTSLLSIFTFVVHKKFDFTSVGSLVITTSLLLIFYFIPAFNIRNIIKKEKEQQLSKITEKQKNLLDRITSSEILDKMKNNYELITVLENLSHKIRSIPNWPNYKFVLKILSVAYSPTVITVLVKELIQLFNLN